MCICGGTKSKCCQKGQKAFVVWAAHGPYVANVVIVIITIVIIIIIIIIIIILVNIIIIIIGLHVAKIYFVLSDMSNTVSAAQSLSGGWLFPLLSTISRFSFWAQNALLCVKVDNVTVWSSSSFLHNLSWRDKHCIALCQLYCVVMCKTSKTCVMCFVCETCVLCVVYCVLCVLCCIWETCVVCCETSLM